MRYVTLEVYISFVAQYSSTISSGYTSDTITKYRERHTKKLRIFLVNFNKKGVDVVDGIEVTVKKPRRIDLRGGMVWEKENLFVVPRQVGLAGNVVVAEGKPPIVSTVRKVSINAVQKNAANKGVGNDKFHNVIRNAVFAFNIEPANITIVWSCWLELTVEMHTLS